MAVHTYVILSATSQGNTCTITGTVDGFPVTIALQMDVVTAQPSTSALQSVLAPLMLQAAIATGKVAPDVQPTVPAVTIAGTFTQ